MAVASHPSSKYFSSFPTFFGIVYCLSYSVIKVLNKIELSNVNIGWYNVGYFFVFIIPTLILMWIQNKINNINKKYYKHAPKNSWNAINSFFLIIGLVLGLLSVISQLIIELLPILMEAL